MQLASGRRRVDAFGEADEGDAERLELLEERDQVLEIPSEPIKTPAHQHIELSPFRVSNHVIERGPAILRAADTAIGVLNGRPASGLDIAPEFLKLVFWFLIECADTGVIVSR